jgi:hypothetical protein
MCFIFLMVTISLSAFFMLGLFVSCVTKEPKTTLTALMALWVLLVLVIPSFSPLLAVRLRPAPSLYQVVSQIATLKEDIFFQTKKKVSDITQGKNWDALSQLERETAGQIWNEYYRKQTNLSAKEIAEIRLDFLNEVEAQAKLSQYLSLISPSAAFKYLATDIAQTGIFSEWDFRRAAIRYHSQYVKHLDDYIEKTGDYSKIWRIDKNVAPPFEYRAFNLSQVILAHLPRFTVLALYTTVFFLSAQIAFIRSQF